MRRNRLAQYTAYYHAQGVRLKYASNAPVAGKVSGRWRGNCWQLSNSSITNNNYNQILVMVHDNTVPEFGHNYSDFDVITVINNLHYSLQC